jgi:50S ribosomal subunit-associated GTPase HflX
MTEHEEGAVKKELFPTEKTPVMSMEELRKMRRSKRQKATTKRGGGDPAQVDTDRRFAELISNNEDELLKYVAKVNRIYQEKLKKPAPFMTFVFCGMQSAGKSTVMERFMTAVLNIVQEGTGTRCPLDTTCIHD